MNRFLRLAVLGLIVTLSACQLQRGAVEPGPGESPQDLSAAGKVLETVSDSVPLVIVRVSSGSGTQERRTVGVVVGDRRLLLIDAAAISLETGDSTEVGHSRSIEAVFHPGADNEQRQTANVLRESAETGLALLAIDGKAPPAVPLGDDVADGARAVLITITMNSGRLVAESGRVRGYQDTSEGRFLRHTAGHETDATGPVFDTSGALIGLQTVAIPSERTAVPAVEIARWLQTPGEGELGPVEPGQVLAPLLSEVALQYRESESGVGYVVSAAGGTDVRVRQIEGIISAEIDIGSLHVGDAIDALRSNYSDPIGALALRPQEGTDQLVWVARLSAEAANADYLDYVMRIGVLQAARWQQIVAGQEPEYPYEHYPGGDEDENTSALARIVHSSDLPNEASGQAHKIYPEADVPVFVNAFRGMAYIYAYSGGMPGSDAAEQ